MKWTGSEANYKNDFLECEGSSKTEEHIYDILKRELQSGCYEVEIESTHQMLQLEFILLHPQFSPNLKMEM